MELYRSKQVKKEKLEAKSNFKGKLLTASKKKKKKVRFCSYDLSAIPPPMISKKGKPKVSKEQKQALEILTQAAKEAKTIFTPPGSRNFTLVKQFRNILRELIEEKELSGEILAAGKYLDQQLHEYLNCKDENRATLFPYRERLIQLQSSHIRFYMKTIFNSAEYYDPVPSWVPNLGSWVTCAEEMSEKEADETWFLDEDTDKKNSQQQQYFQVYHSAELSINLQDYALNHKDLKPDHDIYIFFHDFFQIAKEHKQILGKFESSENLQDFERYLQTQWKKLTNVLQDLKSTDSRELTHFLPLLNFYEFCRMFKAEDDSSSELQ